VNKFSFDTISEGFYGEDITWCFSDIPEQEWDEHTYLGEHATGYDENCLAGMVEPSSQANIEVPRHEVILQPAESSTPETVAVQSQVFPKGESPAAMGQFGSQQEGRLDGDLVCLNNIPETVSLPQLENSTVTRSFDLGRRGGGGRICHLPRTLYRARPGRHGQSCNAPEQAAFMEKSWHTLNTEQARPESTTTSRHRGGETKEHRLQHHIRRHEDSIDHLTFLVESTSISIPR
jgi:hypothetical protein